MQPTSRRPQSLAGPGAHGVLSSWVFVASLVVAMLGLCVMIGWLLGRESLGGIAPGLSNMVVLTASGITVAAVLGARTFFRSHAGQILISDQLMELNSTLEFRVDTRTTELMTSDRWARALTESAPFGVFHADVDGRITFRQRLQVQHLWHFGEGGPHRSVGPRATDRRAGTGDE